MAAPYALPAIIGAANAAGADEINQVDRSLRFNSNDSAYLNRTPSFKVTSKRTPQLLD